MSVHVKSHDAIAMVGGAIYATIKYIRRRLCELADVVASKMFRGNEYRDICQKVR